MTNEEKRSKAIGLIDDLYGDAGSAVVNMLTDYISVEDWGNLYDRLEQDGMFRNEDSNE
jgi:hypothetical protein